jgi:prepilin-type N-terminal cleavage/methylation domain-containing protein
MKKLSKGFTLIELLVVIAIIGILASVVLASLNNARLKGRDAKRISDVSQIRLALELYFDANNSSYPTATSSLVPAYLPVWPQDPGGPAYEYNASTTAKSYVIGAKLEDSNNAALNGDVDGTVTGSVGGSAHNVDCADPNYCVTP